MYFCVSTTVLLSKSGLNRNTKNPRLLSSSLYVPLCMLFLFWCRAKSPRCFLVSSQRSIFYLRGIENALFEKTYYHNQSHKADCPPPPIGFSFFYFLTCKHIHDAFVGRRSEQVFNVNRTELLTLLKYFFGSIKSICQIQMHMYEHIYIYIIYNIGLSLHMLLVFF